MFRSYKIKEWLNTSLIRAHLCTLAVVVSFNATWRVPRDAFRYGGLSYGLAHTVAMLTVGLPSALLQLAVGQLSQQDTVGIWRAVPFFRGVGYLRLLINFLGSVYTTIYLALTITYFLYNLSNPMPFWECMDLVMNSGSYKNLVLNGTSCLNETFMAPIAERPEYYLAIGLITTVLWIVFPLLLYSPTKSMKRIYYALGPTVQILVIVILSCIGNKTNVLFMQKSSDWRHFLEPNIWHRALTQALWSSQVAGGYLVSTGDTVYSNTNVQWTALVLVLANVASSWIGVLFWFATSGSDDNDISAVAVLVQIYDLVKENDINAVWPLLTFATLFLSGVITMMVVDLDKTVVASQAEALSATKLSIYHIRITLLYPLYDRFRRTGVRRWRVITAASSLVGIGAALAVLARGLTAIDLLEEIAVPFLVSLTTFLEICAFVFIYGWKVLVEDIEFLTGSDLNKYWIMGWCAVPGIITPFTLWWMIALIMGTSDWTEPPPEASTLLATMGLALITFGFFASVSVARQVQYDFLGKLKSSFKPSRHWGPRDPITHYYWLARREEVATGISPRTRYHRRQLGQLSGTPSFFNVSDNAKKLSTFSMDGKKRANSDDWVYTVYRREYLDKVYREYLADSRKRRSKSVDWVIIPSRNVICGPNMGRTRFEITHFTTSSESAISSKDDIIVTDINKNDIVTPK